MFQFQLYSLRRFIEIERKCLEIQQVGSIFKLALDFFQNIFHHLVLVIDYIIQLTDGIGSIRKFKALFKSF